MAEYHVKLEEIKEQGKILNSIEFVQLGEMSRIERRKEIIKKIIKYTKKVLEYDNIALWELNQDLNELIPLFSRGYGSTARKYHLKPEMFNNGIVGYVASVGYPYISRNLNNDPHYLPGIKDAKSSITVPFKVEQEVYGVLNVEAKRRSAFSSEDMKLLQEYSGHVAVALNIKKILDIGEEIAIARISKTVAHEINNPLETIFLQMGKVDAVKEKLSEDMIGVLRTINQNMTLIKSAIAKLTRIEEPDTDEEYGIIDIEDPLAGRKILVIDDEEDVRSSLQNHLEMEGCIVETTGDSLNGIDRAIKSSFDIVITDIKMPNASGYTVFQRIRRKKKEQKVIMMTGFGYDESHSIVKGNEEGLNGVLYKPFTPELLKKVLSRVCQ